MQMQKLVAVSSAAEDLHMLKNIYLGANKLTYKTIQPVAV